MNTPFSKILITGAAGFIGSHTTDQLLAQGCEVIGLDNLSTGKLENLEGALSHPGFRFVEEDVLAKAKLDAVCRRYRPQVVIHLAGLVSVVKAQQDPDLNFRLNLEATHLVCEAARNHHIRRIVFASSAATYGDAPEVPVREQTKGQPISLYGAAKLASESIIGGYGASFGIETVCLRYFNVYGPRQDPKSPYSGVISIFHDRFQQGVPVAVFGDGSQTRDFVSVADVARANVLAATRPGISNLAVNVCTGRLRPLLELVSIFQTLFPESPNPDFKGFRPGEILHSGGDPRLARQLLGFEARRSLEEGIGDLVGVGNATLVAA